MTWGVDSRTREEKVRKISARLEGEFPEWPQPTLDYVAGRIVDAAPDDSFVRDVRRDLAALPLTCAGDPR